MNTDKIEFQGFTILPKRDFGTVGFNIMGEKVRDGFVVTKNGCNVMPGATWFQTVVAAKRAILNWIDAGENSDIWWLLEGVGGGTIERRLKGVTTITVGAQKTTVQDGRVFHIYKGAPLSAKEALELAAALKLAARDVLQGGKL